MRQLTLHHASVRCVCDGIDVRWHLMSFLALVHFNNLLRVDRQVLVGVYDDTEEARVRLQKKYRQKLRKCKVCEKYLVRLKYKTHKCVNKQIK